jgi:predicted ATP-dependent protease
MATKKTQTDLQKFKEALQLCDMSQLQFHADIKIPKNCTKVQREPRLYEALDQFLRNTSSHMVLVDSMGKMEDIVDYVSGWFKKNKDVHDLYKSSLRDYVYVNNFNEVNCPILLKLDSGKAKEFKKDMEEVVESISGFLEEWEEIIQNHESTTKLLKLLQKKTKTRQEKIKKLCRDAGIDIDFSKARGSGGVVNLTDMCKPLKGYEGVFEEVLLQMVDVIKDELQEMLEEQMEITQQAKENRFNIAAENLGPMFQAVIEKYEGNEKLLDWLDMSMENVISHLLNGDFRKQGMSIPGIEMPETGPSILGNLIPVIISSNKEVPVIYDQSMGVGHMIGTEKKVIKFGMFESDLKYLTPGLFHKANGGVLLVNIMDLVTYPWSYEVFFKILKSKKVQIESLQAWLGVDHVAGLQPEPFPLDVKVILYFPEMWMYQQVNHYDQEFQEIFADSYVSISRNRVFLDTGNKTKNRKNLEYLIRYVISKAKEHNVKMKPDSILETLRYVAFLSESKKIIEMTTRIDGKLTKLFADISSRGIKEPDPEEIKTTIQKFMRGTDAKERNVADTFFDYMLLKMTGKEKGVSTGLCVVTYDEDIRVCYPAKITAVTSYGSKGLRFLEDDAGFAFECMKKSFYTVSQWLKSSFGQEIPIQTEIGVSFEQNYDGMDGDSATVAMVIAIISALSALKASRKYAITGSMDQNGNVQPIGALMTKIRGYWLLGKRKNLKEMNVVFPHKNLPDLIVTDPDMLNDIQIGRLKLYPIKTVNEALSLVLESDSKTIQDLVTTKLITYLAVRKRVNQMMNNGYGEE